MCLCVWERNTKVNSGSLPLINLAFAERWLDRNVNIPLYLSVCKMNRQMGGRKESEDESHLLIYQHYKHILQERGNSVREVDSEVQKTYTTEVIFLDFDCVAEPHVVFSGFKLEVCVWLFLGGRVSFFILFILLFHSCHSAFLHFWLFIVPPFMCGQITDYIR